MLPPLLAEIDELGGDRAQHMAPGVSRDADAARRREPFEARGDIDAVAVDVRRYRNALAEFERDHLRHITELGDILSSMGRTPPKEGDMKALLTKGKVVIAGLMGDEAILQAMRTNEADTNTAYERAVNFKACRRTRGTCCKTAWQTSGATTSGFWSS